MVTRRGSADLADSSTSPFRVTQALIKCFPLPRGAVGKPQVRTHAQRESKPPPSSSMVEETAESRNQCRCTHITPSHRLPCSHRVCQRFVDDESQQRRIDGGTAWTRSQADQDSC